MSLEWKPKVSRAAALAGLVFGTATIVAGVTLSVSTRSDASTVAVVVAKNPSEQAVSLDLVPSFELSPCGSSSASTYWAPFRFDAADRRLAANARSVLAIPAKSSVTHEIDLAALAWGSVVSSVWPARAFREVVPAGCYRLYVVGEAKDGTKLRSTRFRMTVK